jgi:hypothetical protein
MHYDTDGVRLNWFERAVTGLPRYVPAEDIEQAATYLQAESEQTVAHLGNVPFTMIDTYTPAPNAFSQACLGRIAAGLLAWQPPQV